jgi:hypothetical protein
MLFVIIKLSHSDPTKAFVVALMYFEITIFTISVFSAGAKIHNLSKNWIKGTKQSCRNKLERRIYDSILPLRLYFGNNFVDTFMRNSRFLYKIYGIIVACCKEINKCNSTITYD